MYPCDERRNAKCVEDYCLCHEHQTVQDGACVDGDDRFFKQAYVEEMPAAQPQGLTTAQKAVTFCAAAMASAAFTAMGIQLYRKFATTTSSDPGAYGMISDNS